MAPDLEKRRQELRRTGSGTSTSPCHEHVGMLLQLARPIPIKFVSPADLYFHGNISSYFREQGKKLIN